ARAGPAPPAARSQARAAGPAPPGPPCRVPRRRAGSGRSPCRRRRARPGSADRAGRTCGSHRRRRPASAGHALVLLVFLVFAGTGARQQLSDGEGTGLLVTTTASPARLLGPGLLLDDRLRRLLLDVPVAALVPGHGLEGTGVEDAGLGEVLLGGLLRLLLDGLRLLLRRLLLPDDLRQRVRLRAGRLLAEAAGDGVRGRGTGEGTQARQVERQLRFIGLRVLEGHVLEFHDA